MFLAIFHAVQRLLVFALGLGLVYVTVFLAFPYFNDKLPLALALLVLYCLLAYLAIPVLLHIRNALYRRSHIPLYAITPDGWPDGPVNIAIVANNKRHLKKAMKQAGWYTADKLTVKTAVRAVLAIIFNKAYPNAPFSRLYLFGRTFDIGFQIPRGKNSSPRSRHHVRFWRLELPEKNKHLGHYHFWRQHLQHLFGPSEQVWIGSAIHDLAVGIQWRDGRLTHRTDTDTDKERNFIIQTLSDAGKIKGTKTVQAGEPFTFRGQQWRNRFVCDGNIRVVTLNDSAADNGSK